MGCPLLPLFFVIISHSSPSSVIRNTHTDTHIPTLTLQHSCSGDVDGRFHHHYSVSGLLATDTITISHSSSLNTSSRNAIKPQRNASSFPFDCQMFIPSLYDCTGLLLEPNCFSQFLKFIHISHCPPPSFSTMPSLNFLISLSVLEWPT